MLSLLFIIFIHKKLWDEKFFNEKTKKWANSKDADDDACVGIKNCDSNATLIMYISMMSPSR